MSTEPPVPKSMTRAEVDAQSEVVGKTVSTLTSLYGRHLRGIRLVYDVADADRVVGVEVVVSEEGVGAKFVHYGKLDLDVSTENLWLLETFAEMHIDGFQAVLGGGAVSAARRLEPAIAEIVAKKLRFLDQGPCTSFEAESTTSDVRISVEGERGGLFKVVFVAGQGGTCHKWWSRDRIALRLEQGFWR